MMDEFVDHLTEQRARFDRKNKFVYLPVAKAMSGTIDILLGERAIHPKMNSGIYKHLKPLFRLAEYAEAQDVYRELDDVFIFTFVRNPWDRAVSALSYLRGHDFEGFKVPNVLQPRDFQKFIKNILLKHGPSFYVDFRKQEPSFRFQGKQFANFVGRYENFEQDWKHVSAEIQIESRDVPRLRKGKHKHYSFYYDDLTRDIIGNMFKHDVELLGYRFET